MHFFMFMLSFILVFFWDFYDWFRICVFFFNLFFYIGTRVGKPTIKRWVGIPLTGMIPPHLYAWEPWFPTLYVVFFYVQLDEVRSDRSFLLILLQLLAIIVGFLFIRRGDRVVRVFKVTFNNISVISWWSVLLMEETGVPGERRKPPTCRKSLTNFITICYIE